VNPGRDRDAPAPPPAPRLVADVAGRGPVVVLLHGQPGNAADWRPLVPHLTAAFTVVVPDRLGYGRTGGRAGGFTDNAAAVVELLGHLEVDRALLVGHSWGGGVAIAAAEHYPERVVGLVLLASVGPAEPIGRIDRILAGRLVGDLAAAVGIGGTEHLLRVPAFQRRVLPYLPDPARRLLGVLGTADAPGGHLWRSFADEQRIFVLGVGDLAVGLADIAGPVAVVTGTADRIVPSGVAHRLADAIPGAELLEVPGVGHLLAQEAPGVVTDAIVHVARRAGLL
jgi:pimeloyl-ACP methyl ester carboxylesterase